MIYSAIVTKKNYEGSYFDALYEMEEAAEDVFELCTGHVQKCVTIEIEFIMDDDSDTQDLRAVLRYNEEDDDFDHDHAIVPGSPTVPTTETDNNDLLSLVGDLTAFKLTAYFLAPIG